MKKFFDDNQAQEGLGRKSLRSGVISMVSRGVNVFVQIGSTMCMARMLAPDDFGLVAMVTALTGFAPVLIDLGTRDAAVQKAKVTQDEVSALFWLTVGVGGGMAILMALCSPWIARFYQEAQLQQIALVSSLTFILSALSCQHFALLRRAMMFDKIAKVEIGSNVLGAVVGISMAFGGLAYWSLVARPLLTSLLTAIGVAYYCRWMPGLPKLTEGVKEMLRFGLHITGFTMIDYVGRAADRVALGWASGARELGYYQNAVLVYENALGLLSISLHSVAVASLSKLRDNVEELRRAWATALSALAYFGMLAFVMLAVIGQDVIVLLFGAKWVSAGSMLSVMALRGVPHVVERTLGWLHVAAGRADRWMRWGVVGTLTQIVALLCGVPFGPMGVVVAYTISMYFVFVPAIAFAGRPFGITASQVMRVVGPQLVGALLTAAVGFLTRYYIVDHLPRVFKVLILLPECVAIYLVVVTLVFRVMKPLQVAVRMAGDMVPAWIGRLVGFDFNKGAGKH